MRSSRHGLVWVLLAAVALGASATQAAAIGPAPGALKINEIESSDPMVADYVELINNGASALDIAGYVIKDNNDGHVFTVPAATMIAAGGYYVADVDGPGGFGLGSGDSARLFAPGGAVLLDSYEWTSHATTTYGRCPNATGPFTTTMTPTRGAENICPGDVAADPWPRGAGVATADAAGFFGANLSGLAYEPSGSSARGVLWAVKNSPSTLYRLVYDGAKWTPDTTNGWSAGKQLRYPSGMGDPDAEGVTLVDDDPSNGIYVATERDNDVGTSRPAVLRFDVSSGASTLSAIDDWNLTADLPPLGPNLGLEAIAWLPDDFLVFKGLRDESTGAAYDPASYPDHGSGLLFVGAEQNGAIYAYALNPVTGAHSLVATIASGFVAVMDLEFEPETTHLWAACDDTCHGRTATLDIAQTGPNAGRFVVTNTYERPAAMPDINNEGFAITPQSECADGLKPAFWSDDSNTDMHALRTGTLNCTDLPSPSTTPCDVPLTAVGCWSFGESGGMIAQDASGNANAGTYLNGPLLGVPGALASPDTAVSMDGVNDLVRVPGSSSLDVGNTFTLEGWIKRSTTTKTHQLMVKGFQLVIMSAANGSEIWLRKPNVSTVARTTVGVAAGAYHHIVVTKDGSGPGSVRFYIDGAPAPSVDVSAVQVIQDTATPLYFGSAASTPADYDDFAIYDGVLTPAQVQDRYSGALAG